MVVENKKRAMNVQKRRMILVILVATLIVLIAYLDFFDGLILGISRYGFIGVCVVAYFMYYCWGIVCDYHYCFYNDLGSKLVVRFYSLAPPRRCCGLSGH